MARYIHLNDFLIWKNPFLRLPNYFSGYSILGNPRVLHGIVLRVLSSPTKEAHPRYGLICQAFTLPLSLKENNYRSKNQGVRFKLSLLETRFHHLSEKSITNPELIQIDFRDHLPSSRHLIPLSILAIKPTTGLWARFPH